MPRLLRALAAPLVLVSIWALAALALGSPGDAAGPAYVALGDSYSSGVGTRTYIDDGSNCDRSTYAYPELVANQKGYALNFQACSGATTSTVTNSQLGALGSSTRYVTISVGGNDAGFSDVITECAKPAWASDCHGAVSDAQQFITNTLPGRLDALYSSIHSRAPSAKVVVVGYPRLFNGDDCNGGTFFSPTDESELNQTADLIDAKVGAAASAHGFAFANPTNAFIGHAVCDDPEWLNGLSNPVTESYHPNRTGQASGYTPLVAALL